jgi:hypothetical protein
VKDVRTSVRLADSPSCIVSEEEEPSLQMQQMLRAMGQKDIPAAKPTLKSILITRSSRNCSHVPTMPSPMTLHGCFLTRLCSWKGCGCGNQPPSFNVSTAY